MNSIVDIIILLLQLLWFAIFARAIVSWFPIDRSGPIVRALESITDPILEPLRRVVPRIGMIDITPMVAIILILLLTRVLQEGAATN